MNPLSAFAITAQSDLEDTEPVTVLNHLDCRFEIINTGDSLWMTAEWPGKNLVAFRLAFSATDPLVLEIVNTRADGVEIKFNTLSAKYSARISFPDAQQPAFRYRTTMEVKYPMWIPYWPKDILPLTQKRKISGQGDVHVQQVGTRSGQLYFSTRTGSVFYFQDLTALAPYCQATKTSARELVGGKWPEVGFSLPPTADVPLPCGTEFVISDAFVLLSELVPQDNGQKCTQFLDHLAAVYLLLPRPETKYHDWLETAENGLSDLAYHKGCWTFASGHSYLNAYVCDYKTPAEIMVQLAVLVPLMEYCGWKGEDHRIINELKEGLPAFYLQELKTVVRWVPAMEDNLDKSEEQKRERIMDAWYLQHPLMNLTRLAQNGDKSAKQLLLDSVDYVIKVARHFDYQWPVFYRMDTLKVTKAETEPGKGGEKDVPGSYAHLMLQVWKLTGERRFLDEAKKSAKKLKGMGFDIFYQANNTAFAAQAMLRLYKETGDKDYLEISYACLAGIFKNVQLWDCDYGQGKNHPTFFAVFPLNDAPYTAAYEEQEVYAGLTAYLQEAEGVDIPASIRLLLAEFIRHAITRLPFYYPALLPAEMLSCEVKTGEVDRRLWIPLEDIHDGWEQSGEVGQEVYGAGIAFGVVSRQYHKVEGEQFLVYLDYPVTSFRTGKSGTVSFRLLGDARLNCQMKIINTGNTKLPRFVITTGAAQEPIKGALVAGSPVYLLPGDQQVTIKWKKK
jgi:hypothetical protein